MSAADGMITAGRALGAGEVPGPVFSSPFQVIVFLACWGVALVMAVVLVQCASGQVIKDVDGDGIDDLTVAKK